MAEYIFTKGKYSGSKLSEVEDYGYLKWWVENVEENPELNNRLQELKPKVESFLTGRYRGTPFTDCDDISYIKWYLDKVEKSNSLFNHYTELKRAASKKIEAFRKIGIAIITFRKSVRMDGMVEHETGMFLRFPDTKQYMGDFPYYRPSFDGGKTGKLIKNKTFKVWAKDSGELLNGEPVFDIVKIEKYKPKNLADSE